MSNTFDTKAGSDCGVNRDLDALLKQPEGAQRLPVLGSIAESSMNVAGFDGLMRSERECWAGIVKTIGVTAQ